MAGENFEVMGLVNFDGKEFWVAAQKEPTNVNESYLALGGNGEDRHALLLKAPDRGNLTEEENKQLIFEHVNLGDKVGYLPLYELSAHSKAEYDAYKYALNAAHMNMPTLSLNQEGKMDVTPGVMLSAAEVQDLTKDMPKAQGPNTTPNLLTALSTLVRNALQQASHTVSAQTETSEKTGGEKEDKTKTALFNKTASAGKSDDRAAQEFFDHDVKNIVLPENTENVIISRHHITQNRDGFMHTVPGSDHLQLTIKTSSGVEVIKGIAPGELRLSSAEGQTSTYQVHVDNNGAHGDVGKLKLMLDDKARLHENTDIAKLTLAGLDPAHHEEVLSKHEARKAAEKQDFETQVALKRGAMQAGQDALVAGKQLKLQEISALAQLSAHLKEGANPEQIAQDQKLIAGLKNQQELAQATHWLAFEATHKGHEKHFNDRQKHNINYAHKVMEGQLGELSPALAMNKGQQQSQGGGIQLGGNSRRPGGPPGGQPVPADFS